MVVLFSHEDFPSTRFGHRFFLEPFAEGHEKTWLMEEIDTGALHWHGYPARKSCSKTTPPDPRPSPGCAALRRVLPHAQLMSHFRVREWAQGEPRHRA